MSQAFLARSTAIFLALFLIVPAPQAQTVQPVQTPAPAPALDLTDVKKRLDDLEKAQIRLGQQLTEENNKSELGHDYLDKRIGDIWGWGTWVITLFAGLNTVLVVFFALRTKEAAVAEARDVVAAQSREFQVKFETGLQQAIANARQQVDRTAADQILALQNVRSEAEADAARIKNLRLDALERAQTLLTGGPARTATEGQEAELALTARVEASRPAADQDFQSWYLRGLAAHAAGQYDNAVTAYRQAESLAPDALARARAINSEALSHLSAEHRDTALALWESVVASYRGIAGLAPELQAQIARALSNIAVTLWEAGQHDEALHRYDEVIQRFGDATEAPILEQVAIALFNKGFALAQTGRLQDAIDCYDELDRRFGSRGETPIRVPLAKALLNKGDTLGQANRNDEEIACYDDIISRFGEATETEIREQVAYALYNKGRTLGDAAQFPESIRCYDELVERFGDAPETSLRAQAGIALNAKAAAFLQRGEVECALRYFHQCAQRFAGASESVVRVQGAIALNTAGHALKDQFDNAGAIRAFSELVRRFGDAAEPELQEIVTEARCQLSELEGHAE